MEGAGTYRGDVFSKRETCQTGILEGAIPYGLHMCPEHQFGQCLMIVVEVVRNRLHVQFHVLDVVSVGEAVATPRHFSSADNERRELGTIVESIVAHGGNMGWDDHRHQVVSI